MFAYFIDDWVYGRLGRRDLDRIEMRLTGQGVTGRKIRLTRLTNLDQAVVENCQEGARTFVAVGDDATAGRLLNSLVRLENSTHTNCAFAALPVGRATSVAASLGASDSEEGILMLVRHQLEKIDLGLLNGRHYFLTRAIFPPQAVFDFASYKVSSLFLDHEISICNINPFFAKETQNVINPQDGFLNAVIAHAPPRKLLEKILQRGRPESSWYEPVNVFTVRKLYIDAKEKILEVRADYLKQFSAPVTVEISPAALTVVVGRSKRF